MLGGIFLLKLYGPNKASQIDEDDDEYEDDDDVKSFLMRACCRQI